MGPNGSGSTTLFNILTGLLPPSAGEVRVAGRSVAGVAPHRIARMGVARTFQNLRLFPAMTTTENVLCGAHQREDLSILRALLPSRARAIASAAERRRAEDLLREVGLGDRIVVLDSGRVLVDAAPEAAAADPRVIEAYLGRDAATAA
jgi:branched-chain amino acid transport system ATP-binding protein